MLSRLQGLRWSGKAISSGRQRLGSSRNIRNVGLNLKLQPTHRTDNAGVFGTRATISWILSSTARDTWDILLDQHPPTSTCSVTLRLGVVQTHLRRFTYDDTCTRITLTVSISGYRTKSHNISIPRHLRYSCACPRTVNFSTYERASEPTRSRTSHIESTRRRAAP